jgi:hypothetical protein
MIRPEPAGSWALVGPTVLLDRTMNPTHLRLLAVCAALAVPALASVPALAQSAPAIDANTLAQQRQIFEQGNKLYDQGKLAEAEAAYLAAWKLKKSFDVAGNLGNLEADLKKWRLAAEFLAFAVREFPAGGKPEMRDALLRRFAEVQQQVGKLRCHINRPGAEVFVDNTSIGLAPITDDVYVDPGTHVVEVRIEGAQPVQVTVTATRGHASDVEVHIEPRSANKVVLIAGGVVAGLAVIAGGVFLGLSASEGSTASSDAAKVPHTAPCPVGGTGATSNCANLISALDNKAIFGNVGVWSLVGAGVVGVGTLIYGLAGSSRGPRSGLVVVPVVTAQGGGLFVNGSF